MKRVFLYGLAGVEDSYRLVGYIWIDLEQARIEKPDFDIISRIKCDAGWMKFKTPSVEHVFAISESAELARAYKYVKRNNSIEANVNFKLKLENEGLKII